MQPKMIIKGETAIHGLRGDGANTGAVWEKFEKRYAKKPFEKINDDAYEIRTYDGKKPIRPGADVIVGYERNLGNAEGGYHIMVLPAGEYAVFDVQVGNGYDSENAAMEKWLSENKVRYVLREVSDWNFVVERYVPEKFKDGDKPDSAVEIWLPVSRVSESAIPDLLTDTSFDYIKPESREFITAFDSEIRERGYSAGNTIGKGFVWGRHMLTYSKIGIITPKVTARIYVRESGEIALRFFFDNIEKHSVFLHSAPEGIKRAFMRGTSGDCHHCESGSRAGGECKFRKTYTLDCETIEKCSGEVFTFNAPSLKMLSDYMALFDEFYPAKKGK
jgi:predicted transcriptional regulator YdeE